MINKYLSDKFKIISLISIIMVVFDHAITLKVNFKSGSLTEENDWVLFIQKFFIMEFL